VSVVNYVSYSSLPQFLVLNLSTFRDHAA